MPFWSGSCGCEVSEGVTKKARSLEGERGDGAAECGEAVLVVSSDLLDQAMASEALEDAGEPFRTSTVRN